VSEASVTRWLLDGDPAIRWQVMRDLTHEPDDVVAVERSRVAEEGWGRSLLDRQAPEGWWNADDRGWMITMDALALLREMGVDPSGDAATRAISRVKANLRWKTLGNRPYFDGETEACINGAILAFGSYFGERCDRIVIDFWASSLPTADGTARRRRACGLRLTPRFECWKAYWNTNAGGAPQPPLPARGARDTNIFSSAACSDA